MSLRDEIIAVAATRFAADGYDGVSVRQIAEALGVTKAALYYYYRGKDELFAAVIVAAIARIGAAVSSAATVATTAVTRVRALVTTLLSLPSTDAAVVRIATRDLGRINETLRMEIGRRYEEEFIGRVRSIIADGIGTGELRGVDASICTWALLGMLYPFFEHRTTVDTTTLASALSETFLNGVVARHDSPALPLE